MSKKLKSEGGGSKTYISPFQGVLCEQSKDPRAGFVEKKYKNKDNVDCVKYVLEYSSISGYISAFYYKSNELPTGLKINSWNIELTDEDGSAVVQFTAETKACQSLLKMLPNIDATKEIKLTTFPDKEKGSAVLLAWQSNNGVFTKDNQIAWAYSKENPNGMPQAVLRANGKWDFGAVEDFLFTEAQKFADKIAAINGTAQMPTDATTTTDAESELDATVERINASKTDIPF